MISSLLHLIGLRPRVYYTLTKFRGGGGAKAPLAPPLNTPMILCHAYIPTSFCIAMLVPIPKNKLGNLSESSNYRAIALSSLLCKILDTCIIDKQESVFKSHDLLFAYKANHSTVQCVTMIRETVSYYLSYSNQLFMCMLDASKAFDKVNLLLLFRKLRDKGMCPIILRFIVKLYINQCIQVRWNELRSERFPISNGVKQGGVMSPLLFKVYMQYLIETLERRGLGCHMGNRFTGCFIYADDITLLAPSCQSQNEIYLTFVSCMHLSVTLFSILAKLGVCIFTMEIYTLVLFI